MTRLFALVAAVTMTLGALACGNTDAGITTSVESRLAADDRVSALDIDVTTRDGVVTLRGDAGHPAARDVAVRIARDTEGVRDVVDELRVETAATTGREDRPAAAGREDDDGLDIDVKVDEDVERGVRGTGKAIEKGAEETGEAVRDAGREIRDAVTDRDRDSDNDGK